MLDGLDAIDWAGLAHAYGPAEDVPGLLRNLASDDAEVADEALSEIIGSIFHQGTVYSATVPAVGFLAGLALAAPHHRAHLVATVGMLADPHHAYGTHAAAVRSEVQAHVMRLVPQLADADPSVRAMTAYALAQTSDPEAVQALWERWEAETEPAVRQSILLSLGQTSPASAQQTLQEAVCGNEPEVQVGAALALIRAGMPLTPDALQALTGPFSREIDVDYVWQRDGTALDELTTSAGTEVAAGLIASLLAAAEPAGRRSALWALSERCVSLRSAPARFLPLIAPMLDDPDETVRNEAVGAIRRSGSASAMFADDLAAVAAGYPEVAAGISITSPLKAVETLMWLDDPRWLPPVGQAWLAGVTKIPLRHNTLYGPRSLQAIREMLASLTGGSTSGQKFAVDALASLIGVWRHDAAAAEPELIAALPLAPAAVSMALHRIGSPSHESLAHLRTLADDGNLEAAAGLRRLTGEDAPLIAVLRRQITAGRLAARDLHLAIDSGPLPAGLSDALRAHLTGQAASTYPERDVQVAVARLSWKQTGNLEDAYATVDAVLTAGDTPARGAAELVGQTGDKSFIALLRQQLDNKWATVAARPCPMAARHSCGRTCPGSPPGHRTASWLPWRRRPASGNAGTPSTSRLAPAR